MGLMDNIKKAQEAAQQAQQAGGAQTSAGVDPAAMEYAAKAQKIAASGLPAVATISAISETGKTDASGKEYAIACTIVREGSESYDATVNQFLIDSAVASYVPGAKFEAKVDPDDPSQALLYGFAE